jgi:predicted transcriptional regulator YheO
MEDIAQMDFLKRLAAALAGQLGKNCEITIHDLKTTDINSSIVAIENGHVTGRKIGDGPSPVVLEALKNTSAIPKDHLNYTMRTRCGRTLRCSTIYVPNEKGELIAIFAINQDITGLTVSLDYLESLMTPKDNEDNQEAAGEIPTNINDLLDELIEKSVKLVGKPIALMNKDDKIKAIRFLNDAGAFLVTKSSEKIAAYFGISKYSIYNYIEPKE